jgi:L-2-hydroxyglutarate oxidase LhgO
MDEEAKQISLSDSEPCASRRYITVKIIKDIRYYAETGIVDSHALMESLEMDIMDSQQSSVVCSTRVVRVDPHEQGWVVQTVTGDSSETDTMLAKTLICKLFRPLRKHDPQFTFTLG